MHRSIILVGDTTSHGGEVIGGSPNDSINGRAIARLGDQVRCARHGLQRIAEGEPSMRLDGRPIALQGHRAQCGCVLVGGAGNGSLG